MNKSEMLKQMVDYYTAGNKSQFAKRLGIAPPVVNTWITRNSFDTELIFSKCPEISPVWLLTGEGEMIDNNVRPRKGSEIDYDKVMHLCHVLVENYQQRDHIISELLKYLTK